MQPPRYLGSIAIIVGSFFLLAGLMGEIKSLVAGIVLLPLGIYTNKRYRDWLNPRVKIVQQAMDDLNIIEEAGKDKQD